MSKHVVVTGAAGRIGGGIGQQLRSLGMRVVGVDMVPPPANMAERGCCDSYVQCDLVAACDQGAARDALTSAMSGAQAVVHCAAWPGPSATPPPGVIRSNTAVEPVIGLEPASPPVLLRDNVAATSAVCDAAILAGVTRIVFSSSAFAMGYSHAAQGPQSMRPPYLPMDEACPLPHETYGLSKLVGEQVLETAARTAKSASFVSLRFTNIVKRELWHTLPWPGAWGGLVHV
jgi:UDP-glucose 4-epimerase